MVLGLTHILSSSPYQQVPVLRLENLTKTEVKYAKIYWKYNATARVVRIGEASKGEQNNLGYRFALPLPERMAGVTYVGHAARLRLVLERARRGESLCSYGRGSDNPIGCGFTPSKKHAIINL